MFVVLIPSFLPHHSQTPNAFCSNQYLILSTIIVQRYKIHLPVAAADKVSNSEIIRKHNSRHRRIITGAAIGKTGRIVIK